MRPPSGQRGRGGLRHPAAAAAVVATGIALAGGAAFTVHMGSDTSPTPRAAAAPPDELTRQATGRATPGRPSAPARSMPQLSAEVARLRASRPADPAVSDRAQVAGDETGQPDLYAAAFTRTLLTQNFATPRRGLLGWVQAESAPTAEPTVIGLVPRRLRDRWAVFSLTDGPVPPVPQPEQWTALGMQHAATTVRIRRVTEPMAWSAAVANGTVTDPGATARTVTATVTLHRAQDGRTTSTVRDVALTLVLEGPPQRDRWGFVGAVTYESVPAGSP